MPITDLQAIYRYPKGGTNLPILLMIHGWDGQMLSSDPTDAYYLDRMANYGVFACSVGMRGRFGASGARDVSGREIYDIYDALAAIRSRFVGIVSPTKAALMGMSGGGGNALAGACKFPDAWSVVIDYYGMSDYGRDPTNGWYYDNNNKPAYPNDMIAGIGGNPTTYPDRYYARDATYAISNYTGGKLLIFHDLQDTTVYPIHSQRIVTAMGAAGLSNYSANYSDTGSPVRWTHGFLLNSASATASEAIFIPEVLSRDTWSVPTSGSVKVIGYIKTKLFEIWLGNGLEDVADVVYDVSLGQYTVTPKTGSMDVTIRQGVLSAVQTISTATLLQVT